MCVDDARDLSPLKWSSLKYYFDRGGAAPFCGPGSMQFLGLFEFGVRTRSASSYRARYVVFRCCSDARKLPARTQRHPLGFAFGCAVARSAGELRASDHLLQTLRSLAVGLRSVAENKFVDLFYAWPPSRCWDPAIFRGSLLLLIARSWVRVPARSPFYFNDLARYFHLKFLQKIARGNAWGNNWPSFSAGINTPPRHDC